VPRNLHLTVACSDYDRTRALRDGRVVPDGCDLTYLPLDFMGFGNRLADSGNDGLRIDLTTGLPGPGAVIFNTKAVVSFVPPPAE